MTRQTPINAFQYLGETEPCVMLMMDASLHDYIATAEASALDFAASAGVEPIFQYPEAPPMGDVRFVLLPRWVWWASHRRDA